MSIDFGGHSIRGDLHMRQTVGRAVGWEAALSRDARERVLKAVRSVLYTDPPVVTASKSVRFAKRRTKRARQKLGLAAARRDASSNEAGLSPLTRERRLQVLTVVHTSLTASGVDARVDASDYWAYIAVRERDLEGLHRALQSLRSSSDDQFSVWLGGGADYSTPRALQRLSLVDLARSDSVVVGVPYRNGTYSIGHEGGVEILIIEPRDARLVARRSRAVKVDWTAAFAQSASSEPGGSTWIVDPDHDDDAVDVVYTWVDSSDPTWMRRRDTWSADAQSPMESAANEERFADRDELRYSLRSLWAYAPLVRRIHIVTQGHRPSWLVDDNDRVRVISHEEIFPDTSVLPTFNSHAIEACLHRIPGLSENFLYFNDDVFLGREVGRSDFFTKAGLGKCRFSESAFVSDVEPGADAIPTDWASYNAARLVSDEFGIQFDRKLKHVPHAMKKSVLEDMELRYPHIFAATRGARFREHTDFAIPSMFAQYFGIATRQAVEWAHVPGEYMYTDTGQSGFDEKLRWIASRSPKFFCLNVTKETDISLEMQADLLGEFLSERYPIPSPYEIDTRSVDRTC